MLVRRLYDNRLAQASYLIGCQRTGEAIAIDPPRDIAPLLAAAKDEGVRITRVTETHIHADFLSGTRELAAATKAQVLLSGEGGADWQYAWAARDGAVLLKDGDVIPVGNVKLQVLHTPGHTPEHLSFVVIDGARGPEPVGMLSGDFIFVGDVGRPDLLETAAGVVGSKDASARQLYKSLQRLTDFPDYLQIWPGHGAGSACGKALGALPSSTLGYERRTNWAFQANDEAAFLAAVLEGQPSPPRYFGTMKRLNREGPALVPTGEPKALPANEMPNALRDGVVIDLRPLKVFAAGHLPGTLNIPPIKAFTKWAGWLLPYDKPLYLISPDARATADAQRALQSIGLDQVAGVFGPDAVTGELMQTARVPMPDVIALQEAGTLVVDLREPDEWATAHLEGAVHHPLGRVPVSMAGMDRDTPIALHCEGGTRSAIGASVLQSMGFTNVTDLTGGWSAWLDAQDDATK